MDFFSILQHLTSSAIPAPLAALSQPQGGTNMLAQAGQPQDDLTNTFPAPPQVDWLAGLRGTEGAGPNGSAAYQNGLQTAFANSPPSASYHATAAANGDQTNQKTPLQRLSEALMQTPDTPAVQPRMPPLGNPSGHALLDYLQNSPYMHLRRST